MLDKDGARFPGCCQSLLQSPHFSWSVAENLTHRSLTQGERALEMDCCTLCHLFAPDVFNL